MSQTPLRSLILACTVACATAVAGAAQSGAPPGPMDNYTAQTTAAVQMVFDHDVDQCDLQPGSCAAARGRGRPVALGGSGTFDVVFKNPYIAPLIFNPDDHMPFPHRSHSLSLLAPRPHPLRSRMPPRALA